MTRGTDQPFDGQVVWVTGASEGIGEALASVFAAAGARLVLSARREVELQRVAEACGGEVMVLPLDVTDADAAATACQRVLERFGAIDVLVNNAGLNQRSLVAETGLAVYRRLIEVNYLGAVALTLAVLPHMRTRGQGLIVALGSPAGEFGTPLRSGYAAAKHAVHGFFESLRAEVWQDGIRVSILVPGPVRTNVTVNALVGDGSRFGEMDQSVAAGLDPGDCARRAVAGLAAGEEQIYIVTEPVQALLDLKRTAPAAFRKKVRDLAPK